jgi:hypothetical protein
MSHFWRSNTFEGAEMFFRTIEVQTNARTALMARTQNDPRWRMLLEALSKQTGLTIEQCANNVEHLAQGRTGF